MARERRFAGVVAFVASLLLVLTLFIPPAPRLLDSSKPVWTDSFGRFIYLAVRHYSDVPHQAPFWWALVAVLLGIVAFAAGLSLLIRPGRAFAAVLAAASALCAAAALMSIHVSHDAQGIGSWGALAAAVVAILSAVGVIVAQQPQRALAGRSVRFVGLAGVLAVAIAAVPLMLSGSSNVAYTASAPQVPESPAPAVIPSSPDFTPPSPSPTPAGELNNTYDFSETESGGYTFSGTLSLGSPEQFQGGITQGTLTAGSACSINDQTDAVIPAVLDATNTSPNFNAIVGVQLSWSSEAVSGIEVGYSNGPQCEGQNGGNSQIAIRSSTPSATGQGLDADMFIVVPNYFSPQYPSGNASILSGVDLQLVEYTDSGTNVDIVPQTVSGPGASSSDGLYIPVDADAPAVTPSPSPSQDTGAQGQTFQITGDDVAVRAAPNTSSATVASVNSGDNVSVLCTVQGEDVNNDTYWDKIASPAGYVSDAYVNTDNAQGIPSC